MQLKRSDISTLQSVTGAHNKDELANSYQSTSGLFFLFFLPWWHLLKFKVSRPAHMAAQFTVFFTYLSLFDIGQWWKKAEKGRDLVVHIVNSFLRGIWQYCTSESLVKICITTTPLGPAQAGPLPVPWIWCGLAERDSPQVEHFHAATEEERGKSVKRKVR